MEIWSWEAHAAGLQTSRHRGMEAYCRRADVEAQRYEGLEVRCRRVDVEVFVSRGLEMRCRSVASKRYAGIGTWRCLPQEIRSSGGAL